LDGLGRFWWMSGQEKITVNLNAVDLAKVDYLAEHGFYNSRSDFIRTAIRSQLREHEAVISDAALKGQAEEVRDSGVKSIGGVGILSLTSKELEGYAAQGRKLRLFIVGTLIIAKDVTVEQLERVLDSARVYGALRGPQEAVDYIRELKQTGADKLD